MASETKFEMYFLSTDLLELINNSATDIKISGTFDPAENKIDITAEGVNTKTSKGADSSNRSLATDASVASTKFPCPMPCSTMNK